MGMLNIMEYCYISGNKLKYFQYFNLQNKAKV